MFVVLETDSNFVNRA